MSSKKNVKSKKQISRSEKKGFRLRSTKFFLTYSQLPHLEDLKETALSVYENIFRMNRDDFKYLISVEAHKDGNPHLHVYLEFGMVQAVYSADKLDLEFEGKMFHGNYQAVRSPHSTMQYIIKSVGDPNELALNFELPIYRNKYYTNINEHLYDILVCEGEKAAVDVLYRLYKKESIQRGSSILTNLSLASLYNSNERKAARMPKYTLSDFIELSSDLDEWVQDKSPMTLFLSGRSGTGKTELAKALLHQRKLKSVFIRNRHALKEFNVGLHQAILFDDIDPDEFTREEMINLVDVDNDSQIRVLYGYADIPAGTIRIITTNRPKSFTKHGEVIQRRIKEIEIDKPQFLTSPTSAFPSIDESTPVDNLTTLGVTTSISEATIVENKKKRGRPLGSKNKSKPIEKSK